MIFVINRLMDKHDEVQPMDLQASERQFKHIQATKHERWHGRSLFLTSLLQGYHQAQVVQSFSTKYGAMVREPPFRSIVLMMSGRFRVNMRRFFASIYCLEIRCFPVDAR